MSDAPQETKAFRCEHCGQRERVRFDKPLQKHLCDSCWVKTPVTPPKPSRP